MKRIITLFTIPRSGSTPISEILGHYFWHCFNYNYLPEYLSYNQTGVSYNNGLISLDSNSWKHAKDFYRGMKIEEFQRIQRARIQYLKKSKHRYFFKVFPFQAGSHRKWLLENSKLIFLYRENLFEHLLSYLISETTYRYYEPDGLKLSEDELVAEYETFFRFLRLVSEFKNLRRQYPKHPIICFEKDFAKKPWELMEQLGFNRTIDWSELRLPTKQNKSNKLKLFKNKIDIFNWYKDSVLQEYYPIPDLESMLRKAPGPI